MIWGGISIQLGKLNHYRKPDTAAINSEVYTQQILENSCSEIYSCFKFKIKDLNLESSLNIILTP